MTSHLAVNKISMTIPAGDVILTADLQLPHDALGVVVFAHGSGSSRLSPRNRFVAASLNEGSKGTLLLDLLTEDEEREDVESGELRFNVSMLASRLTAVTDWILAQEGLAKLPLGYFGASTGAAAALIAAVERPTAIKAIVSRGGRPDLAGKAALRQLSTPTLFIVGGLDTTVLELNRQAIAELPNSTLSALELVPGATHLFDELGTLDRVAQLAGDWFYEHLRGTADAGGAILRPRFVE